MGQASTGHGSHRSAGATLTVVVALALGLTGACSSSTGSSSAPGPAPATTQVPRLAVVATTPILGDVVRSVLGDRGDVTVVARPGEDPRSRHRDRGRSGGLGHGRRDRDRRPQLRARSAAGGERARDRGVPVVTVLSSLSPLPGADGQPDPHVWMDPDRVSTMADQIARALHLVAGDQDWGAWQADVDGVAAGMAGADEAAQGQRSTRCPRMRRVLVTTSDGLAYWPSATA